MVTGNAAVNNGAPIEKDGYDEPIIADKRGEHDSISENHEGQARQACDIVGA